MRWTKGTENALLRMTLVLVCLGLSNLGEWGLLLFKKKKFALIIILAGPPFQILLEMGLYKLGAFFLRGAGGGGEQQPFMSSMKVKILSWNVKGLDRENKRSLVRNLIQQSVGD